MERLATSERFLRTKRKRRSTDAAVGLAEGGEQPKRLFEVRWDDFFNT